jgi:hypothetical protein
VNYNDARISRVYVTETGGTVPDDTPNAPVAPNPPATNFDLHLEMEAGGGVAGGYKLLVTAEDVTAGANNAAMAPPAGPLNGAGNFATAPWVVSGGDWDFGQKATITVPPGVNEHMFRYNVALLSNNFQISDTAQSDLFILAQ